MILLLYTSPKTQEEAGNTKKGSQSGRSLKLLFEGEYGETGVVLFHQGHFVCRYMSGMGIQLDV